MNVSNAVVEEVPIASIKVGVRRRKAPGRIAGLATSIQEHGLIHPILIRGENELVAGARRLAACTSLGWKKVPARRVDRMSDDELRAIELEENTERAALQDYEASKQRLAEIRQAEATAREASKAQEPAPNSVRKPGRPPSGGQKARAKAAGVSQTTVRNLEKHVELAERFPFMQGWPQHRVLEAGIEIDRLPKAEHGSVAAIVGQEGVPPKDAIRILNNLAENVNPDERRSIYEAARSNSEERRKKALCAAANVPPGPGPLELYASEAIRSIQKGLRGHPDALGREHAEKAIALLEKAILLNAGERKRRL